MQKIKLRTRTIIIYMCSNCTKSFKTTEDLDTHMNTHSDKHSDKQIEMDKVIVQAGEEQNQNALNSTEDSELYEFIMSDILEGNKTNNDESKDKNDYNNETSMKIHAREKPCQCKQCEKDFIDINTGETANHFNEYDYSITDDSEFYDCIMSNLEQYDNATHTIYHTEKPCKCYKCKDEFAYEDDYSIVDMDIDYHTNEKPLQCNICKLYIKVDNDEVLPVDRELSLKFKFSFYEEQINRIRKELESKENIIEKAEKNIINLEKVCNFYRNIFENKTEEVGEKCSLVNKQIFDYIDKKEDKMITELLADILRKESNASNELSVPEEQYNELLKLNESYKLKLRDNEKIIRALSENLYKATTEITDWQESQKILTNEMDTFKNEMKEHAVKMTEMKGENRVLAQEIERYIHIIIDMKKETNNLGLKNKDIQNNNTTKHVIFPKSQNINAQENLHRPVEMFRVRDDYNVMDNYPHEGENKFYTKTYYNQNFKSNSLNPLDSKRVTVNN